MSKGSMARYDSLSPEDRMLSRNMTGDVIMDLNDPFRKFLVENMKPQEYEDYMKEKNAENN